MAFVDLSRTLKQNIGKIVIGLIVIALISVLILGKIKPAIDTIAKEITGG